MNLPANTGAFAPLGQSQADDEDVLIRSLLALPPLGESTTATAAASLDSEDELCRSFSQAPCRLSLADFLDANHVGERDWETSIAPMTLNASHTQPQSDLEVNSRPAQQLHNLVERIHKIQNSIQHEEADQLRALDAQEQKELQRAKSVHEALAALVVVPQQLAPPKQKQQLNNSIDQQLNSQMHQLQHPTTQSASEFTPENVAATSHLASQLEFFYHSMRRGAIVQQYDSLCRECEHWSTTCKSQCDTNDEHRIDQTTNAISLSDNVADLVDPLIRLVETYRKLQSLQSQLNQFGSNPYEQQHQLNEARSPTSISSGDSLHLLSVCQSRIVWVLSRLSRQLRRRFSKCLTATQWPQSAGPSAPKLQVQNKPLMQAIAALANSLMLLQLIQVEVENKTNQQQRNHQSIQSPQRASSSNESRPSVALRVRAIWLVDLLIEPIESRFRYHFGLSSQRPTARIDKPEWYIEFLSQIDAIHSPVIATHLQPVVDRCLMAHAQASHQTDLQIELAIEFRCALISLANDLLSARLNSGALMHQPVVLRHTVDQLLLWEQELRSSEDCLPSDRDGVLQPLVGSASAFQSWIDVEKDFINDRLELLRNDTKAYQSVTIETQQTNSAAQFDEDEVSGSDAANAGQARLSLNDPTAPESSLPSHAIVRATHSSQSMISLLSSVTLRYRLLPRLSDRIRFFHDIQTKLIDIYIEDLNQDWDEASKSLYRALGSPTQSACWRHLAGIANSCLYVLLVLQDWSMEPLFVELSYFQSSPHLFNNDATSASMADAIAKQVQKSQEHQSQQTTVLARQSSEESESTIVSPLRSRSHLNSFDALASPASLTRQASSVAPLFLEGTIFDPLLSGYESSLDRMIKSAADLILAHFRRETRAFRHSRNVWCIQDDQALATTSTSIDSQLELMIPMSVEFASGVVPLRDQLINSRDLLSSQLHSQLCARLIPELQTFLFDEILVDCCWSRSGVRQCQADLRHLVNLIQSVMPSAASQLPRILDTIRVLQLSVEDQRLMPQLLESEDESDFSAAQQLIQAHSITTLSVGECATMCRNMFKHRSQVRSSLSSTQQDEEALNRSSAADALQSMNSSADDLEASKLESPLGESQSASSGSDREEEASESESEFESESGSDSCSDDSAASESDSVSGTESDSASVVKSTAARDDE